MSFRSKGLFNIIKHAGGECGLGSAEADSPSCSPSLADFPLQAKLVDLLRRITLSNKERKRVLRPILEAPDEKGDLAETVNLFFNIKNEDPKAKRLVARHDAPPIRECRSFAEHSRVRQQPQPHPTNCLVSEQG